jgi:hypothetical protein
MCPHDRHLAGRPTKHKSPFNSLTSIHACSQSHSGKDGVYFITFIHHGRQTCTNWLPLFKICNAYDAVYTWFNNLRERGHYIIGCVSMPGNSNNRIRWSRLVPFSGRPNEGIVGIACTITNGIRRTSNAVRFITVSQAKQPRVPLEYH